MSAAGKRTAGSPLPPPSKVPTALSIERNLKELAHRWAGVTPAERANAQSYITELCEALEVERPRPSGSGYEYEHAVRLVNRDGSETTNFVDLFKRDHFLLEAKDQGSADADTILLRKAYGQARAYAAAADGGPPPYLMVMDVGRTLLLWDRWSGSYGGFSAATRILLPTLAEHPEHIALLRDVFEDPQARNPTLRSATVTKDIAEQLANLAASLEDRGYEQERIARFLIRCVFTMFAEDVDLIPDYPFTHAIDEIGFADPDEFAVALAALWRAMDEGSRFGLKKFLRFNGHFFRDQEVLPLTKQDLVVLRLAAESSWDEVEPSIMGTLLVRALDPVERHRLGAEFTPREFVERVVRPTVEEPIRERWTAVQAEVLQLRNPAGKTDRTRRDHDRQALERLRDFHTWLRGLSFLDPACGSGNFLYVTLAIVKQVELEVTRAIEEITDARELAVEEVGPWQFYGIEVKPWAREIAELTLWIGYHQWWRRTHGHTLPPEPVLRDTGTLECRDAILTWTDVRERPELSRPDPTPRIPDPVTGALIPDPTARLIYYEHCDARPAAWPRADFIVGNPPYIGQYLQKAALGVGYVDALREAYVDIPDSADLVMYWWYRAALEVAAGRTIRAGLITTRSIADQQNRTVIEFAQTAGAEIIYAVPDHPWVDDKDAAAVWVAMTVISKPTASAVRYEVDHAGNLVNEHRVARLNSDLTGHADVVGAARVPLAAGRGLASRGFKLHGPGFILEKAEAERIISADPRYRWVIKPLRNGGDVTRRPREAFLIDFGFMSEEEARAYPVAFNIVRDRVKPERDANAQLDYRTYWWRFGRPRQALRDALRDIGRYIVTTYVAKHTMFSFLPADIAPDDGLICIATDDAFVLGVLSSRIHEAWALAAGGVQGKGHTPRYNISMCFDPFPFPHCSSEQRGVIATLAEQIDTHRKDGINRDKSVTLTGMYNVVEKLRSGEALTVKEREINAIAACGILRELHDALDVAVANAYGWTWPLSEAELLDRLVSLHDQQVEEDRRGETRWLRPDYQRPRFAVGETDQPLGIDDVETELQTEQRSWPASAIDQIRELQHALAHGPVTVESAAGLFRGARKDLIERHLQTLALMGEVLVQPDGSYSLAKLTA